MPRESHRLFASHSGMCLMEVVLQWSWSGGLFKTSPSIEGLDKEKGHMRALRQHVFPLINGYVGIESKSNET